MTIDSARQSEHFERIHDDYVAHYYDVWSMRYRDEFIYPKVWNAIDLNGKKVAELACGSGQNSQAVIDKFPHVQLAGFDISQSACDDYQRNVRFPAFRADLTKPMAVTEQYDMAFIIGGLHHCVVDLEQTLSNVAALLNPGGRFVMLEPNAQFFLESIREIWYRIDKSFDADTEHALNHNALLESVGEHFNLDEVSYFGGPGYFGILNSMILRIPPSAKPLISPPLLAAERIWNKIPNRRFHNVFLGRWIRTNSESPLVEISDCGSKSSIL